MSLFLSQSSKIFTFLDYNLWHTLVFLSLKYSDKIYGIFVSFEACEAFVNTGKICDNILLILDDTSHMAEIVILLKERLSSNYHLIVQLNYILISPNPSKLGKCRKEGNKNGSTPSKT